LGKGEIEWNTKVRECGSKRERNKISN